MSNKDNMSFEEALSKLEKIVASLEDGSMTLNDSIDAYEEARKLLYLCEERLEGAKQRVYILNKSKDGTVSSAAFVENSDET